MSEENIVIEASGEEAAATDQAMVADTASNTPGELQSDSAEIKETKTKEIKDRTKRLAERVLEQRTFVEKLLAKDRELSDDLPFDEWRRRREDQQSGRAREREALAKDIGTQLRVGLAAHASATLEDSLGADLRDESTYDTDRPLVPADSSGDDLDQIIEQRAEELNIRREHLARVAEIREAHPELPELAQRAVEEGVDIAPEMAAIIEHLPNSADLTFHLLKDLDFTQSLSRMSPTRAIAEITKLSAQLQASKSPQRVTNAPAPPTPVRRSASGPVDINDPNLTRTM